MQHVLVNELDGVWQYLEVAAYCFVFSTLSWFGNVLFVNSTYFRKPGHGKFVFFLITVVLGGLFALLYDYSINILSGHTVLIRSVTADKRIVTIFLRGALFNWLNAFLVFHLKEMQDNEQNRIELEHLKQANLQANISSLKEQLSPHFLFNTFNTLVSLSSEQRVKDYVSELANVYRYLLRYQKNDVAALSQELAFTESYLYIIKARLENAIEINIDIDESLLVSKIPPLTLQLLIENAIKHNITAVSKPLKIRICSAANYLVVTNNYQPKNSVQTSSGIGLNNIAQRYLLLFNKEVVIENDHDLFTVKLPLII